MSTFKTLAKATIKQQRTIQLSLFTLSVYCLLCPRFRKTVPNCYVETISSMNSNGSLKGSLTSSLKRPLTKPTSHHNHMTPPVTAGFRNKRRSSNIRIVSFFC